MDFVDEFTGEDRVLFEGRGRGGRGLGRREGLEGEDLGEDGDLG